jgi:hypothetical protein
MQYYITNISLYFNGNKLLYQPDDGFFNLKHVAIWREKYKLFSADLLPLSEITNTKERVLFQY